jgi:hypothetical protein
LKRDDPVKTAGGLRLAAYGLRLAAVGRPSDSPGHHRNYSPVISGNYPLVIAGNDSPVSKNIFSLMSQKRKSLNTTKTAGTALMQRILLYLC